MSASLALAERDRVESTPADAFVAASLPALEKRLAEECRIGDGPLARLGPVLSQAIGTDGRGGARWRPLLALAATSAYRPDALLRDDALDVAVAVELTHTASLVLDDLPCMDDADRRRPCVATHRLVGSAGAILLSVGLLARAAELLGRQPRIGGALAAEWGGCFGLAGMAGGQAMDVAAGERAMRGAERRLHRAKSSALPAFALAAGAHVAGAGSEAREGLAAFGRGLGWAYQLRDDSEDRAEDERNGRVSAGDRPLSRSARILDHARRRLARVPGLEATGVAILSGLSTRIVPAASNAWSRDACSVGREA